MDFFEQIVQNFPALMVLILVLGIVITINLDLLTPSQAFLTATLILLVPGIMSVEDFLISFSNKHVITIFILIFITVAIRQNTDVDKLFDRYFKTGLSPRLFLLKLTLIVAFFSSFLNNTPVVSMLTSNVQDWSKRKGISPSKLLIPLSYAAILGGMITIIGTSTNLVLQGLISSNNGEVLGLMDFFVVGGSTALIGVIFLVLFSDKLLPDRKIALKQFKDNIGEYIHEVEIEEKNDIVGKTALEAGLKNLQGIYLVEISRNGDIITPVSPDVIIKKGDHLYFAGDTELVVEFVGGKNGLMLSSEDHLKKVGEGDIAEVVISANSKLSGILVKDSEFRESYNASIVGLHRNGEKISGKIGHLKLRSGDLLLLLTGNDFERRIINDKNLYLLSHIKRSFVPGKTGNKTLFWILQSLIGLALLTNYLSFFLALLLSLFTMVSFRYLSIDIIKKNFNFDLLIVLACSIALGKTFIDTGAADMVSGVFLEMMSNVNIKYVLISLFIFTAVLTSLITNVAAVSIAFPVAYALAHGMNMETSPFYLTIAFAASAAFMTPMAYQTNMMVYGPGGYKSSDFIRAGLPLLILYMISSLLMIFWWFEL